MNSVAAMVLFPSLLAYAGSTDLLTMKIANWVSVTLFVGFISLAYLSGMPVLDILENHVACGIVVLALTFVLFAFGWIGGGDAKLAAATAVWLGWANVYEYSLEASLLGGGLTLCILALRKHRLPSALVGFVWIERLHKAGNGVPYGIALAAAGLAVYPNTAIWGLAASS